MSERARVFGEAVLVFVMVLAAYGYFFSYPDGNTNSRLALVKAVVEQGQFEVDSYVTSGGSLETSDRSLYNGHYYSDKAIGASMLGVGAYYPVRWVYARLDVPLRTGRFREWMTFLAIGLPAAWMAPLLYWTVRSLRKSSAWAFLVTLAICLGTPLFKYSTAFYAHALAAALFFAAFFIWFQQKQDRTIRPLPAFVSGFLLGLLIVSEFPAALLALALGGYILHVLHAAGRLLDWKPYALMLLGFVLPVSIMLFYNYACFGNPFTTGYGHEDLQNFRDLHGTGLFGIGWPDLRVFHYMTFHVAMGIFWQSPILFLAIPGWVMLIRNRATRAEGVFSAAGVIAFVLLISGVEGWWAGRSYTPRYLIPMLPLFGLPLAALSNRWLTLAVPAALVSLFHHFMAAAAGDGIFWQFQNELLTGNRITGSPGMLIYEVTWRDFVHGWLTENLGKRWFGLSGYAGFIPLFALELALAALYIAAARLRPQDRVPAEASAVRLSERTGADHA